MLVLLIQGAVIASLWFPDRPAAAPPQPKTRALAPLLIVAWTLLVLAAAALATSLAVRGAERLTRLQPIYSAAALAASAFSIVLALPTISTGMPLAAERRAPLAITAHVIIVILNLCGLLPLLFAMWHLGLAPSLRPLHQPFSPRRLFDVEPLFTFPVGIWRIDNILLILLGLMLVPVALGRLRLPRWAAALLIAGYCAYLLLVRQ